MAARVIVKYISRPTILWYTAGSSKLGSFKYMQSLVLGSIGIGDGFDAKRHVSSKRPKVYFIWQT